MADYMTMTPGSAVADTVQQILQRKRDMERQALIDRLGIEKFRLDETETNARMEDARARLKLAESEEARQGRVADANIDQSRAATAASEVSRQNALFEQLPHAPQDTSGLSNELQDLMVQRGRGLPGAPTFDYQTPSPDAGPREEVSAIDRALGAGKVQDLGSEDYQKEERARELIRNFRAGADPTKQTPFDLFTGAAEAGVNLPAAAMPSKDTILNPGGSVNRTITGFGNDNVDVLPNPPQPNAANAEKTWNLVKRDNPNEKTQVIGTTSDLAPYLASGWVSEGSVGTYRPPQDQSGNINRAAIDLARAQGMPRGAAKDTRVAQAKQTLIAAMPLPPHAITAVQSILERAGARRAANVVLPTPEEAREYVMSVPGLTPDQQSQMLDAINATISDLRSN
jgi:hypothetical protein